MVSMNNMYNKYKYIDYGELRCRPRKFVSKYDYLWLSHIRYLHEFGLPQWDEDEYRDKKMKEFLRNK